MNVTVSNTSQFANGDRLVINRGWPKWMYMLHVPLPIRNGIRRILRKQEKWGESGAFTIASVKSSNTLKLR